MEGAQPLDARARTIFQYFKNYNYEVAGTGEVIKFVGNYRASKGQAAALILYTFLGAHRLQGMCCAGGLCAAATFGGTGRRHTLMRTSRRLSVNGIRAWATHHVVQVRCYNCAGQGAQTNGQWLMA